MKKKQFLAVLLAAVLVAGSVPVSADPTPSETQPPAAEQSAQQEPSGEQTEEAPEQTEPADNASQQQESKDESKDTETPAGEETANKTEEGQGQETPAAETPAPTATPAPSTVYVGETGYESLAAAVAAADDKSEIKLTADQALGETVTIPAGKTFSVTTGDQAVKISRSAGFTGSLFSVAGTLNLGTDAMAQALTLDGTLSGASAAAPLVNVAAGGTAVCFGKTSLINNKNTGTGGAAANAGTLTVKGSVTGNSAAEGGAIANSGTLNLSGAVISKNTAGKAGGGIDNSGTLNVSGLVKVTGNTIGTAPNNIYLKNAQPVNITAALAKEAQLGITAKDAKGGLAVLKAAEGIPLDLQTFYVSYDSSDYTISDTGVLTDARAPELDKTKAALRVDANTATVYFDSNEAGTYYFKSVEAGAAVPTVDTTGEGRAMAAGENTLKITDLSSNAAKDIYIIGKDAAGNLSKALKIPVGEYAKLVAPVISKDKDSLRTSVEDGKVYFTSDSEGTYYFKVVEAAAAVPEIDTSETGTACKLGSNTITLTNLTAGAKDIYILAKNSDGSESPELKITIPDYQAPIEVKKADASKNAIAGVGSSYQTGGPISFSAIGDRMDETEKNANKGDERYVPYGYAIFSSANENLLTKDKSEANRGTTKEWTSNSGAFKINKADIYTLAVYYSKEVFDGKEWVATGEQDTKSKSFVVTGTSTKAPGSTITPTNGAGTPETPIYKNPTYTSGSGTTSTYRSPTSGSGSGSTYRTGTTSGSGTSTSRTGSVKTADESPVMTMALLLLASGGIAVFAGFRRKRIKKAK